MDSQRQQLLHALQELGDLYPQWRFGQLVENASAWAGDEAPLSVGEASDAAMLRAIMEHLNKRSVASSKAT
jgi:hypothetical protein